MENLEGAKLSATCIRDAMRCDAGGRRGGGSCKYLTHPTLSIRASDREEGNDFADPTGYFFQNRSVPTAPVEPSSLSFLRRFTQVPTAFLLIPTKKWMACEDLHTFLNSAPVGIII